MQLLSSMIFVVRFLCAIVKIQWNSITYKLSLIVNDILMARLESLFFTCASQKASSTCAVWVMTKSCLSTTNLWQKRTYACRWWECVALPEDVDSSEEELFRQQIRDLAFTVIMQQIIHFIGHYETNSPRSTDGIIGHFNGASFSLMYQFNILYGQG